MTRWLSISGLVFALDQFTKHIVINNLYYGERIDVLPFFQWVRFHNEGAAFSFLASAGPWKHWFFVTLGGLVAVYLIWELARLKQEERHLGLVFSLILGGALGNVCDRLLHGHVIDFIYFSYAGYSFPAFNIADMSLFFGAAIWIFFMIIEYRQGKDAHRS